MQVTPSLYMALWMNGPRFEYYGEAHGNKSWGMSCPLWLPLLLIAAPTFWLFYTDRRAKPWQCAKCRYDLRGIDTNKCPECGKPTTTIAAEPKSDAGV